MIKDIHKNYLFDLRDDLLYKRLTDIRKRPGLWLDKKSLKRLDQYIRGFYDAYITLKADKTYWISEFFQYVCDVCVNGNPYGPSKAIFECGYDDETGFDYYYELLDDYIRDHAVVNDKDIPEEVFQLKNELRMVYIDWNLLPDIVSEYVGQNRNRLFHLIGNESPLGYDRIATVPMSHDGILFGIYDRDCSEISAYMEEYLNACEGAEQGISYKVIKFDEKDGK